MSLNLGQATASLNSFFGAFAPQRWKQDLFYREIRDSEVDFSSQEITEETALQIQEAITEFGSGRFNEFSNTRGVLAIDTDTFDKSKALFFQFNPETISDSKTVEYADRQKPGFDNADYIWSKGGGRTITFELMLDATLSSSVSHITTSNVYTHSTERGTLNQVEFLQSLIRPYEDTTGVEKIVPLFSNSNGITPDINRFTNPPQVAFSYGPIYLVGVITDLGIEHEAFKKNLAPVRSKVTVTFRVREDVEVISSSGFSKENAIGAESTSPKKLKTTVV